MKHDHVRVTCDAEGCDFAFEGWVESRENGPGWAPPGWQTVGSWDRPMGTEEEPDDFRCPSHHQRIEADSGLRAHVHA